MAPSSSVLHGTLLAPMTRIPTLVGGEPHSPIHAYTTNNDTVPNSNYATMRFEPESVHAANAGLNIARDLMEKVKQEFPWISYGDLWTLGGVAAIQVYTLKFSNLFC